MYVESNSRALIKAVTWRGTGTAVTAVLVYVFTGSFKFAAVAGGIEAVGKMALYFIHERFWNKVKFGKKEVEPAVFWLTGYSGAGKKPIAHAMAADLRRRGLKVELLEGDKIRKIFRHIGYSRGEREEHVRRVGYLAGELEKHGIVVIVSMTSPFAESRDFARQMARRFVEVHVATPIEDCESRDPKGLWKKARQGELPDFVGIDLGYESPASPEVVVDMTKESEEAAARKIIAAVYR